MRRRIGFTLIELLVVIGIMAVLISMLLPALSKARNQAIRTQCLSNIRSLTQALYAYSAEHKGHFPPQYSGIPDEQSWWCYYPEWGANPATMAEASSRGGADGFVALGYLVRSRQIRDGRTFYCPSMEVRWLTYDWYERMWNEIRAGRPLLSDADRLRVGYWYRKGRQEYLPYWTTEEDNRLNGIRPGKFKGVMSLISDVQVTAGDRPWPHRKPYGANVGFSDGHGEWIGMTQRDFDAANRISDWGSSDRSQIYTRYWWWAVDKNDIPYFTSKVRPYQPAALEARYPHY